MQSPEILSNLLQACARSGVTILQFKSNIRIDYSFSGQTDFDIYVNKNEFYTLESILISLNFKRLNSQVWSSYPGVYDWIGYDADTGKIFHLHLHTLVVTGIKTVKELVIPVENIMNICKERSDEFSFPMPDVNVELSIFIIRLWAKLPLLKRAYHIFTGIDFIKGDLLEELTFLSEGADVKKVIGIIEEIQKSEISLSIKSKLAESDLISPHLAQILAKEVNGRLKWSKRLSAYQLYHELVRKKFLKYLDKTNKRWLRRDGVKKTVNPYGAFIAVVGVDGTGKTTVVNEIKKWLKYKVEVKSVYLGSRIKNQNISKLEKKIISFLVALMRRADNFSKNNLGNLDKSFFGKVAKIFSVYLLWRRLRLLKKLYRFRSKGAVVISDRFPQLLKQGQNDGPKLNNDNAFDWMVRLEKRLMSSLCKYYSPDCVVMLSAGYHIVKERRKDMMSEEDYTEKRNNLFSCHYNARVFQVDMSSPTLDENLKKIKEVVWKTI